MGRGDGVPTIWELPLWLCWPGYLSLVLENRSWSSRVSIKTIKYINNVINGNYGDKQSGDAQDQR